MATKHDLAILNSVFNPLLPIGECPVEDVVDADLQDDEELTDSVIEAKRLEMEAVKKAETGNVEEAIEILSNCIQLAPRRPSGYNNRAQAYRLKGDVSGSPMGGKLGVHRFQKSVVTLVKVQDAWFSITPLECKAALQDLNNALNLSGGKGKSACLAYCQRALIYRLQEKQKESVSDFEKAAELGSAFARSQLVLMNPYAALCNQMLRKVISQYQ